LGCGAASAAPSFPAPALGSPEPCSSDSAMLIAPPSLPRVNQRPRRAPRLGRALEAERSMEPATGGKRVDDLLWPTRLRRESAPAAEPFQPKGFIYIVEDVLLRGHISLHANWAASAALFPSRAPAGSRPAYQGRVVDAAAKREVGRRRSGAVRRQPAAEFRQSHLGAVLLDQPHQPDPLAPLAASAADLEPLKMADEITQRHDQCQPAGPRQRWGRAARLGPTGAVRSAPQPPLQITAARA
jgi:hypothetical protein